MLMRRLRTIDMLIATQKKQMHFRSYLIVGCMNMQKSLMDLNLCSP